VVLRGGSVDGPVPTWVEDAQELYEVVGITGWDEEKIDDTPGFTLDGLRMVADVNKMIERERLAEMIARAIHGR
jgi:hypothetical protein